MPTSTSARSRPLAPVHRRHIPAWFLTVLLTHARVGVTGADVVLGGAGANRAMPLLADSQLQSLAVCGRRPRAQPVMRSVSSLLSGEGVTWTGLCVGSDGLMIAGPKQRILARGMDSGQ